MKAKLSEPKINANVIVRRMKSGFKAKMARERIRKGMELRGDERKYYISQYFPQQFVSPVPVTPQDRAKPREKELVEIKRIGGFKIEPVIDTTRKLTSDWGKPRLENLNIKYSLRPKWMSEGESPVYVNIRWEPREGGVVYYVIEPMLPPRDAIIINSIKKELEERLDVDFLKLGEIKARDLLKEEVVKLLSTMKDLSEKRKNTLLYYIERDIIGFGIIDAFMSDPHIEDISCDGVGIPIYIYHRDPKLGSMKTNVVFKTDNELNFFVVKLSQRCKKTITIAEPLLDASLPDGSRVQATLGTDIARRGSNFTIRRFTQFPLTPTHMLEYGTLDSTQLAYLWMAIEHGQSILISGSTATGKTSLLNALSLFIKPNLKVISIEDTAELRLPHPHWVPEVARSALSERGTKGEVTLFDLLKSSMRQRPDYIVMGEVRGREAFVLFQQMSTGHPSLATIHAASLTQLSDRLTTPPISLPPTLLQNINIIIFLVRSKVGGDYVRRADNILEVVGVSEEKLLTRNVFEWKPLNDTFDIVDKSVVLENISRRLGMTEDTIKDELNRRKLVLDWMRKNKVFDYRNVAKIVSTYYTNPKNVLDLVERGE